MAAPGRASSQLSGEQIVRLLAGNDAGGTLNMVSGLNEMAETDQITHEESEGLQSESRAARTLDDRLASGLRHRQFDGETSSADYLRELSDRPRMPVAVERRLVQAAKAGDRRAREQLIEAFLPLIAGVARVYRGSPTITRLELMQEGVVGLLRALERYDLALGVPFWGYAAWWVRQAMQQLVAELTRPMVLSDRALRQLSQLGAPTPSMWLSMAGSRARVSSRPAPGLRRSTPLRCSRSSEFRSRSTSPSVVTEGNSARSANCSSIRSPTTLTSSSWITARSSRSARCSAASTTVSG